MATLYIAEFENLAPVDTEFGQIAGTPPIAEQTVGIGGASVQSSAFNAKTKYVRLHTDSICSVKFGTSPTATTANMRLAANQTEYFGVANGAKVAVISNT